MVTIISPKKEPVTTIQGVTKILGRKVLSKTGDVVGKVVDIVPKGKEIAGIVCKKRLKKTFIDIQYVADLYTNSVMLNIDPATRYEGMQVFNADGEKLGKVIEVNRTTATNAYKSLTVKKNMFTKKNKIAADKVESAHKNIILKQ
jgi:sporulation protein YlmC with PRC-barrel domain